MKEKKVKFEDLTSEDLINRLKGVNEELGAARLKFRLGQFKKTSDFSRLRKEIARIMTHLRSRELKSA